MKSFLMVNHSYSIWKAAQNIPPPKMCRLTADCEPEILVQSKKECVQRLLLLLAPSPLSMPSSAGVSGMWRWASQAPSVGQFWLFSLQSGRLNARWTQKKKFNFKTLQHVERFFEHEVSLWSIWNFQWKWNISCTSLRDGPILEYSF